MFIKFEAKFQGVMSIFVALGAKKTPKNQVTREFFTKI